MSITTFNLITWLWIGLAVIVCIILFFVKAPFGRHTSTKFGAMISNQIGWIVMEIPSLLIMLYFLFFGSRSFSSLAWFPMLLWILHYLHRSVIYPFRIKPTPKKMPAVIAGSAIFFNVMNAGLNGYYLGELSTPEQYSSGWLSSPSFIIGLILFVIGMGINLYSDIILINLRKPGETGYVIPNKFLFKYVASPNLMGEIIEWIGFAILVWSLPAFSFMIWTMANLIPRARNHFQWYRERFPEYPKDRKILVPGIW